MKKKNVSIYALMLGFLLSLAACSEDKGESWEQTAAGESFICIEQIIDGCIDIFMPQNIRNKSDITRFAV